MNSLKCPCTSVHDISMYSLFCNFSISATGWPFLFKNFNTCYTGEEVPDPCGPPSLIRKERVGPRQSV